MIELKISIIKDLILAMTALLSLFTSQPEELKFGALEAVNFGATERLEVLDSVKKQELSYKKWNSDTVPIEGKVKRVNGEIVSVESKRFVSSFSEGWKNYLDANHEWKSINTNFVPTPRGWEMKDAPFEVSVPLLSDGVALF